jgi:uncharacterized protein (DUF1778 family)
MLKDGQLNDGLEMSVHQPYMMASSGCSFGTRDMSGKATTKVRDERLEARVSRDQKALFQRAAELQGRTLTDFVIASVHDAAVRVIEEAEMIRLNAADGRAFAEALLNPREPNARLKAAAQRYLKLTGA